MQNSSKHFNHKTDPMMACPCCEKGTLAVSTLMLLETVRDHFGKPVVITSGARCRKHQMEINPEAENSRHIAEKANGWTADGVDFKVIGIKPSVVRTFLGKLPYSNLLGIGKYTTWTHADTRGRKARW